MDNRQSLHNSILSVEEVKSCIHGEYFNRDLHLRWSNSPPMYSMLAYLGDKVQFSTTPNTKNFVVGVFGDFTGYVTFYAQNNENYTKIEGAENTENIKITLPANKPNETNQFIKGTNEEDGFISLSWDEVFQETEMLYVDKVCVDKVAIDIDEVSTDVVNHVTYDLRKIKVFSNGAPERLPCVIDGTDCCVSDPEYPIPPKKCGWELPSIMYFKPQINDFVNYWYIEGNVKNLSYRDLYGRKPDGSAYWNTCLDDDLQIMPTFTRNLFSGIFSTNLENYLGFYNTEEANSILNSFAQPECSFNQMFSIPEIPMFYVWGDKDSNTTKDIFNYHSSILEKYRYSLLLNLNHPVYTHRCNIPYTCRGWRFQLMDILGINPLNVIDFSRFDECPPPTFDSYAPFKNIEEFFTFWDNESEDTKYNFWYDYLFYGYKFGSYPAGKPNPQWKGIYVSDNFVKVNMLWTDNGAQLFPYAQPEMYVPEFTVHVGLNCHDKGEALYRGNYAAGNITGGIYSPPYTYGQNYPHPPEIGYGYFTVPWIDVYRPFEWCYPPPTYQIPQDKKVISPRYANDNINKIFYPHYPFMEYYNDSDKMHLGNLEVCTTITFVTKKTLPQPIWPGLYTNDCNTEYSKYSSNYVKDSDYILYSKQMYNCLPISGPKVIGGKFEQYFLGHPYYSPASTTPGIGINTTNTPPFPYKIYSKNNIRTS